MSDNEYSDIEEVSDEENETIVKPAFKTPNISLSKYEDYYEPDDAEESDEDIDVDEDIDAVIPVEDDDDVLVESDDDAEESDPEEEDEDEEEIIDEAVLYDNLDKKVSEKKHKKKQLMIIDEDEEEEDESYNDNYLEKFDSELVKNYIDVFHPECLSHNYDEISKFSNVIRNSDGIIIDPLHRTIPYLTKYEKARILGQRAKQIETGSKPFIKVPENIVDGYIIAELELKEKKMPFIIKRPIPGGGCEYWSLKDLEMIAF
jgi:DNA-directed RNA polymerase I, II, and III subunit RPABC2